MAGHEHFAFKKYKNPEGYRILARYADGSITFQLAQVEVGPGKFPISVVLYMDGTLIERNIPIHPIYSKLYNMLYYMLHYMLYIIESNSL